MPDEATTDGPWSAEDPETGAESPSPASGASTEGDPPDTRGTRAGRRSARDQSTRDENARTERDEARARAERAESALNTMRAATIRDRVSEHLANPDDLALVTTAEERAAFWNEDGSIDEGALAAALDRVLTERPHWKKPPKHGGMDMGNYGTARGGSTATWSDVIRGR